MSVTVADEQDLPVDTGDLVALARHVLEQQGVPGRMELSLLLVDADAMAKLHERYLDEPGPTDVLAFPIDRPGEAPPGAPAVLGDVVLCPEVAAAEAGRRGHDTAAELRMLTAHGILHLLGMDHADPRQEREMFGRTDELLASYEARARSGEGG